MNNQIHDFEKKNAESSQSIVHNFVIRAIKDFFEGGGFTIKNIEIIPPEKSENQLLGIDYKITLDTVIPNHEQIYFIDSKVRFFKECAPDGYKYDDIMLEYISNDVTKSLGWIEKNLKSNYILYIFWDIKIAYWLPFPAVKKVWKSNKDFWLKEYGTRPAPNKGYNTLNCPVPIRVLYGVMNLDGLSYIDSGGDPGANQFFNLFRGERHA